MRPIISRSPAAPVRPPTVRRAVFRPLGIAIILAVLLVLSAGLAWKPGGKIYAESPGAACTFKHSFLPERLNAYSGGGFDLFPDLIGLLELLEAKLAAAPANSLAAVIQGYTRFTNPEFVTFQIYTIKPRDNFWALAKRRGYTIDTIVGCNPQLEKVICYQGQKILLPSRGGSLYRTQPDETLEEIALLFAVDPKAILAANFIDDRWGIVPNMWLFIPGAKPRCLSENMRREYRRRCLFRSPLTGRYTSFVGKRIHPVLGFSKFHNGVDIACRPGTWVGAAASGTVEVAGWGGAIGNYIKIDHHNGYKTMYGHLSQIHVRPGQRVRGGQLIARSGSTGRSTGPHLHFTIWENGVVRNPMDYLW